MSSKKTTIDKTFSRKMRFLIEEKLKITQGEFAKNVGVTAGYVSMVATGKRGPSAELIAGIFAHYSEHLAWLLNLQPSHELTRKIDTKRKYEILNEVEEWLDEEVQKNPENEIWFKIQIEKSIPGFKEWKRKRDQQDSGEYRSGKRQVA